MIDWARAADPAPTLSASTAQSGVQDTSKPELQVSDEFNYIRFYGQINKGLLGYDDGRSTLGYFPVDNDSSSTRFGIRAFHRLDEDWSIGGNVEAEWEPYSTDYVNQITRGDVDWDWDTSGLRKAEVYIESAGYGQLWLGQGSLASDGTAEADLSGTTLVGYSSVADIAGAQFYRLAGGMLSDIQVGGTFKNLDGLGRKFRVRYDTPDLNGLVLGASVGQQIFPEKTGVTVWDVAAKYNKTHGDYKVSGAVAFSRPGGSSNGIIDGSISALHDPTGFSATFASALDFQSDRNLYYFYGKLGRQTDYFDFGKTAFSVDVYYGENIKADGSESVSFGIQAVQSVDYWQTDFYLGVRSYDYDDSAGVYKKGLAVITGTRIKF